MIIYDLSLDRQNLLGADRFSIAAESNETVSFRFHFDRSWRIFDTKAAVFKSAAGKYYVLDILSNCVRVPWEVLRSTSGFELAVVAYENEIVQTSKKVHISVSSSLLPEFCRQLSPSETLFDRIKEEAKDEAYLEYKDEIRALKREHSDRVIELGEQIEDERRHTAEVAAQKDAQIAQLNYDASCALISHNAQVAELQAEIAEKAEKAHNWDLVDTAIRHKTVATNQLWAGGSEPFELPMMNITSLSNLTSVSTNLTKGAFNMANITSIAQCFEGRSNLTEIRLINTEGITDASYAFSDCSRLQKADIGNLVACRTMNYMFSGCRVLEEINLGELISPTTLSRTFNSCRLLKTVTGTLNVTFCTGFPEAFKECARLEDIRFSEGCIGANLDMGYCSALSKESIYSIANGLNGDVTAAVTFSDHAFLTNLTADERTEVTNLIRNVKGWTLNLS